MKIKKIISSVLLCLTCIFCGSCSDGNQNYQGGGAQVQQNSVSLNSNNLRSYATIDASLKRLDRNTVYFDNYLVFDNNVEGYRNLKVSVRITYNVSYTLSNGRSGSDTRVSMVTFNNNQKVGSSIYFSLSSSIVQIKGFSTNFSVVNASGTLVL